MILVFLYYGVMYLLLNMWVLYVVGLLLEMWLGWLWFGVLYVVSVLGGLVLVYLIVLFNMVMVGVLGVVFGFFGVMFMVVRWFYFDVCWVVVFIVINLVFMFFVLVISW